MRRVLLALLLVAGGAGCGSGGEKELGADVEDVEDVTTTTTTTAPETTTTAPPPSTTTEPPTTTAPPAQPLPAAGPVPKGVVTPAGVMADVVRREGAGYVVRTPCGREATVATGTPVMAAEVVLDPGHGGGEPGAVSPDEQLSEKVLNLAVSNHAKAALEAQGVTVAITRPADYRLPLEGRARIVKAFAPKAFVSIHHNAEPDQPWPRPGTETYYQTKGDSAAQSKRLAGLLWEELVKALEQYQGVQWVADRDAGAKYRTSSSGDDYYGILRRTQGTPASLAELGFISNPPEAELYKRPEVQKVEGEAVAAAIVRFLRTQDPGSGFVEPYPRETPAGGGGGSAGCVDPPL